MKALLLLMAVLPLAAQDSFPKYNFSFGAGAGLPRGELRNLFADSPGLSVGFGYRFMRNFQADTGLDILFGAAGVREFVPTDLGYLRIRDRQYMWPFGGRVVLPFKEGRVQASVGGGGVYLRYSERLSQPSSYYRFECPNCTARSGWGAYGVAATSMALDQSQRFRVGVTAKVYRGHTDGEAIGSVPGLRTRDMWVNLFADLSVGF